MQQTRLTITFDRGYRHGELLWITRQHALSLSIIGYRIYVHLRVTEQRTYKLRIL